jgi:hypothetical protein
MQWLTQEKHCLADVDTMNAAAYGGNWLVVEVLTATYCEWTADTCKAAIAGGNLDVLIELLCTNEVLLV